MSVNIWNATEQKLEQVGGNVNINDSVISEDSTWSSEKINDELETKVDDRRKLLSTISMTTTEKTLAIEDISDYKYFEIIAQGSSKVRGSSILPQGLSNTGAVIPCFYGDNMFAVTVYFPTNTSVKVKTNKAEIDMLYIYGIKY